MRVFSPSLCEWFPIESFSDAADPNFGWDQWVFFCFFLVSSPLVSSLVFLADLSSSLPSAVSYPFSSIFPASVTHNCDLLRCFELVCFDLVLALGSLGSVPVLDVKLGLGWCYRCGAASFGGPILTGSTCSATVLGVAAAGLEVVAVASVVFVFLCFGLHFG